MYLSFICIMSNKTTVIHIGRGATRTFARGGGNILFCNGLVGGGLRAGFPPFRKFLKTKVLFLGFEVEKKEILSCCMQIWLCSIQIDFLFLCFYKIYTFNSCKMNYMSQFIEYVCESQKSIF